ncbi:HAD family hydrolase [Paenibacillus solisilvae]|uniref:HAD family hydrolase n=1 Tax=Paenibacillus solisilvae TaxID=2486751 RepID=A0ABW0W2D4_9BACL
MIKAVVFDFDGLIIDTETPCYHAFNKIYREYGAELPLPLYAQCVGTSFDQFNPYTYLSEVAGETIEHSLIKDRFKLYHAEMLIETGLRPGVMQYLEAAKQLNLKIGLASSSPIAWIEPYLSKFNLRPYFDSLATADDVSLVKPDPELYLLSLQRLGVHAEEAISFEDSLNGFHAARTAGLHCVVVPNELTKLFDFSGYDLLLGSMEDMALTEVIAGLRINRCGGRAIL